MTFAELSPSTHMIDYAVSTIDPSYVNKAKAELTEQELREIVDEMSPLLGELGYH